MPKFIGEITRTTKSGTEKEEIKLTFVATDWMIAD